MITPTSNNCAPNGMELETTWRPSPALLRELLDGGQSFAWDEQEDGSWLGQWQGHTVHLYPGPGNTLRWAPGGTSAETPNATLAALRTYLGLDEDWERARDDLPWRSDPVLARAMAATPGLRLLRQPLDEVLLGFMCSAQKTIPMIKRMLRTLAVRFGPGKGQLPGWEALAEAGEAALRDCGLGYRARHIAATACLLRADPAMLVGLGGLPYSEAKAKLIQLPGVGGKIADCVLLFGAGHPQAFPVDTWIERVMHEHYHLHDWPLPQIAHFGQCHFGEHAGLAQQYLFAWARRGYP